MSAAHASTYGSAIASSYIASMQIRPTREELYALVWSKPMTDVATEFGMSSVAFAKHCNKLNVPRPVRTLDQRNELSPQTSPATVAR